MKTRPIVIRMSPDLIDALKAKAAREERSMAQHIRHVLREWVEAADGPSASGGKSGSG